MKLKRPKTSFATFWRQREEEKFIANMRDLYGLGYLVLSRKNLKHREKIKLNTKIESQIDKRILAFHRRWKDDDGNWRSFPGRWDERNKRFECLLYERVKRMK